MVVLDSKLRYSRQIIRKKVRTIRPKPKLTQWAVASQNLYDPYSRLLPIRSVRTGIRSIPRIRPMFPRLALASLSLRTLLAGTSGPPITNGTGSPVWYPYPTGDPVPLVIGGPDVPASRVLKLSEASASRGNIGRIRGIDLMPVLTDLMGRSRLYGS